MTTLDQIAKTIIKEQELIIGPVAWSQAAKVSGLHVSNQNGGAVSIDGDASTVIDGLVKQYEHLFGRASREVCKEAAGPLLAGLSPSDVPASLK